MSHGINGVVPGTVKRAIAAAQAAQAEPMPQEGPPPWLQDIERVLSIAMIECCGQFERAQNDDGWYWHDDAGRTYRLPEIPSVVGNWGLIRHLQHWAHEKNAVARADGLPLQYVWMLQTVYAPDGSPMWDARCGWNDPRLPEGKQHHEISACQASEPGSVIAGLLVSLHDWVVQVEHRILFPEKYLLVPEAPRIITEV